MTKYNFFIPGRLPGMNDIVKEARGNKYASAMQKKKYTQLVADVVRLTFRKYGSMGKVWINFTWIERNRMRDPDNVSVGKKFILDGLVLAGLLKGDGWANIVCFTDKWEVGKEPGVYVEIREV